ncbi:MAG: mechanosensitive ion channel [Bacteroidaceae bacterium]|nr:mechanosensitive ion channel [Bacteroidaceae bacterium]
MENYLTSLLRSLGIESGTVAILYWVIVLTGIVLLIYCSRILCSRALIPFVKMLTRKTETKWDEILLNEATLRIMCNMIVAVIIIALLPFVLSKESVIYTFAARLCWVYLTVVSVQLACSLFAALNLISTEAERTKNHTLQGVFQMLKIIAICIGAIIVASIVIDKNPMKLLAGLGASAAVLMLVFKDSIMGLVAGVQLSANDMLRPGDWITMPKYDADGFVVDVTLTTVKVRNWDNTISTIPPYALVSDSFQNWRGMWDSGGRRIKRSIFIDMNSVAFCSEEKRKELIEKGYLSADRGDKVVNLTAFREWLEEWLHNHPSVNNKMTLLVRQLQPTPQGLPLELYFFYDGINWVPYEHLQAEVFEYLFAVLPEFGLRAFQAPSGSDFLNNRRIPSHLY